MGKGDHLRSPKLGLFIFLYLYEPNFGRRFYVAAPEWRPMGRSKHLKRYFSQAKSDTIVSRS